MGTVFLAEHALIRRRVAIKILHPDLATDADVIERFMNEARAAGTLGHPNIVESTDMGFTHGHVPYIVFEYLEGTLLTDEVYRVGGLPVRRAVRIAQQIASALHAAHHANIVHRDLKSDNVFLTDKDDLLDHVKVLDFGISRFLEIEDEQTRRGMVMGTPEFMAPEQITHPQQVDRRADIYALGVILYEMLTARRPFSNDEDPRALMHRIVNDAPPPLQRPEVPHGLAEMILHRLLAKRPDDRYASMLDVEAALDGFITDDGARGPRRSRALPSAAPPDVRDLARRSDLIPRPVGAASRDTPWPGDTIDPLNAVALPPPPARRPYALYGMAAAGLALGAGGLLFGLRDRGAPPVAPAPVAQPTPALPAAAPPAPREAAAHKIAVQLDANAANARVTFRRRVSAAPATLQITPSDIIELVEVSAPGYKTVRYWLTFDRPTTLHARLAKGTGMTEATEEETLIALGEVAAPQLAAAAPAVASPVPVAAAAKSSPVAVAREVPVAAKTVARAATPPSGEAAPARKIGKAAAIETTATATAPELAAPVAAGTDPVAPGASGDDSAPPSTSDPRTTATDVAPAPAADSEPASEPRPAMEPPPAPIPSIDKAVMSSMIGKHRPEILKCFAEGKKHDAAMKGTVNLQLVVDAAGKVRAQVQSTLKAPLVAACVIRAASSWRFPARAGGEPATISYPFTIH